MQRSTSSRADSWAEVPGSIPARWASIATAAATKLLKAKSASQTRVLFIGVVYIADGDICGIGLCVPSAA